MILIFVCIAVSNINSKIEDKIQQTLTAKEKQKVCNFRTYHRSRLGKQLWGALNWSPIMPTDASLG